MSVPPESRKSVVLLGASNLTKSLAWGLLAARTLLGGPLDFYVALGRGRSYGARSALFYRELPGITGCGLWQALDRAGGPVHGLVMDIGNDILYQSPAPTILRWIETCLGRLQLRDARLTVLDLPLRNVETVTPAQLWLVERVFFARHDLDLQRLKDEAHQVKEGLDRLTQRFGATLVAQNEDWYGFDPIHIKRASYPAAWRSMLAPWASPARRAAPVPRTSLRDELMVLTLRPEERSFFGWERRAPQPQRVLPDGSTISVY